jgi:hypothetical protein
MAVKSFSNPPNFPKGVLVALTITASLIENLPQPKDILSRIISPLPLGERARVRGKKGISGVLSPPPSSLPPQGGGRCLSFFVLLIGFLKLF